VNKAEAQFGDFHMSIFENIIKQFQSYVPFIGWMKVRFHHWQQDLEYPKWGDTWMCRASDLPHSGFPPGFNEIPHFPEWGWASLYLRFYHSNITVFIVIAHIILVSPLTILLKSCSAFSQLTSNLCYESDDCKWLAFFFLNFFNDRGVKFMNI
jgi:hypothetical protein